MKKIIIAAVIIVLVLITYFGQVAYMGTVNSKIHALIASELDSNKNDLFTIETLDFQKGFFTSKASFHLYVKTDDPLLILLSQTPILVEVYFKNNIFASDNISIDVENPFYELIQDLDVDASEKIKIDKIFLNLKMSLSPSQTNAITLKGKVTNLDIQTKDLLFKLDNFTFSYHLDENGTLYSSKGHLDEFIFNVLSDFGNLANTSFSVKNVNIEEKMDKGVHFSQYLAGINSGESTINIKQMNIGDFTFSEIGLNVKSMIKEELDLLDATIDLNIKNVSSPKDVVLDNISSHTEMGNIFIPLVSYLQDYNPYVGYDVPLMEFFASNPAIELSGLSFSSKGKEFNAQGVLRGSLDEYSLRFFAQSEAVPNEILPFLSLIGDSNELFVEKDGKYNLDFSLESDYKNNKMTLNGKDLSQNTLN